MKWFTHIGFSVLIFVIIIKLLEILEPNTVILGLAFVIVGGIFPDIDLHFNLLSKHRGVFHSLIGLFASSFILMLFLKLVNLTALTLFFFVGYFFHLLIDSFNPSGIIWLPITRKSRGGVKTGGLIEKILAIIVWSLAILLVLI